MSAVGFWGLNIGLAMMVVLSLFPSGVLQMHDVIQNGYWHARSLAYTAGALPRLLEWLRLPGDLVFIVLGAAPIALGDGPGLPRAVDATARRHGPKAGSGRVADAALQAPRYHRHQSAAETNGLGGHA